jgi:anti-sigma B factor antagonist
MTTPLKIDSRTEAGDAAVLRLAGEVDVANVAQVREAALKLLAAGVKQLVVDLSATEYLDSSGLGILVGLLKRLKEIGGDMAIAGPQPRVKRLFEITGLSRVFALHNDVAAALLALRREHSPE